MLKGFKLIRRSVFELFFSVVMGLGVVGLIYYDIAIRKGSVGESSIVEMTQVFFLAVSVAVFYYKAYKYPEIRGGMVLVGSFLLCAVLRELDFLFDQTPVHWTIPVTLTVIISVVYSFFRNYNSTKYGIFSFMSGRSFSTMSVGLIVVLVYSRLFGSKKIWTTLFDDSIKLRIVKNAIEEGLELLGYSLIFLAVMGIIFSKPGDDDLPDVSDKI